MYEAENAFIDSLITDINHLKDENDRLTKQLENSKETIIVKEFVEKLKEKIEFREQELIISCNQIEGTDMCESDLFRTAREYGLYNIIDQLAKEYGVEVEE